MNVPETPTRLAVKLVCPDCEVMFHVELEVMSALTTIVGLDGDVEKTLYPQIRKQKVPHVCHQSTLDDAIGA